MVRGLSYKTKQFFLVLIKLSIVVGAFYFIYRKTMINEILDFNDFLLFLSENDQFSLKNGVFLVVLSFFNWFFESAKWSNLVNTVIKISGCDAWKQSLAALTASLFTPNRIGDYVAKAIYYHKPLRKRILLLNLISNIGQMGSTVIFGLIGCILFINKYNVEIFQFRFVRFVLFIILILIIASFRMKQNKVFFRGFLIKKIIDFIKSIPLRNHLINLFYSIIRYLIFSFQFYFLLLLFDVDLSYINAMIVITTMYFLASVIPSIFIFDVVIKGSVALYLFSLAGVNEFSILSIVAIMWILNFAIPSIIGSFYVLKFNMKSFEEVNL